MGISAIQEMMNKGMLIDIDHMSEAAANQTISLAQPCVPPTSAGCVPTPTGYPLNSGHNTVRGVTPATAGTERNLTKLQYQEIGKLHGMAGVGSVNLDACTWMNEYNAVVSAMGTNESSSGVTGPEVVAGFGTDWFLAAGMPPRLGSTSYSQRYTNCVADCNAKGGACSAEPLLVAECRKCTLACATKYPGTTHPPICNGQNAPPNVSYKAPNLPISSLGNKSWDYNTTGVAHYGMLPDFLQDIQSLHGAQAGSTGVTGEILANGTPSGAAVVSQMNSGAQYFYQTWRTAENVAAALKAAAPSSCTPNCAGKCGGVSDGCGGTCTTACPSRCTSSCGTVTDTKCGASNGCGGTCKGYCAPTGAHEICTGSITAGYSCQATGP